MDVKFLSLAQRVWYGLARLVAVCVLVVPLTSCGDGSGGGGAPGGFTLLPGTAIVAAPRDSSGRLRVHIERQSGFSGPIELDLADPPDGISADTVIVEADDEAELPLHIAADVETGVLGLVVSGTGGGATATVTLQIDVQAAQPRSPELIQAALDAGQIDYGTSLLYRAYAVFGSARLPAAFVGSGPDREDSSLFVDIERARPTLPPAILHQLQPFLVRPDDPQSVFNVGRPTARRQRLDTALAAPEVCEGTARKWITARSTLYPVRAWVLCRGTAAGNLKAILNLYKLLNVVDTAYGKMTELMGPAVSDVFADARTDVYDDAIDVYLVPPNADAPREGGDYAIEGVRGAMVPQGPYGEPPNGVHSSSGYVMLPTSQMARHEYPLTLIHELFHVLQHAHNGDLGGYWFAEASADWAAVYFNKITPVPPADNGKWHREDFGGFQKKPHSLLSTAGKHEYYSYIWPFFMEQEMAEDPSDSTGVGGNVIGSAWEQFGFVTTHEQATAVLNSLLPFKTNFRVFAVRNVNESLVPGDPLPLVKRYRTLDGTFPEGNESKEGKKYRPKYDKLKLTGKTPVTRPVILAPLEADYLRFDVVPNSGVQSVEFDFSGLSGREHLGVDALIQTTDGWVAKPVPLNDPKARFCFDFGPSTETVRGSFVELRLVLSNHAFSSAFDDVVTGTLRVRPSRSGCAGWSGTTLLSLQNNYGNGDSREMTIRATVTFEVDENVPVPFGSVRYKIRSGSVSIRSVFAWSPGCLSVTTGESEMVPDATSGPGATEGRIDAFTIPGGITKYFNAYGATFFTQVEHITCRGEDTTRILPDGGATWWNPPGGFPAIFTMKNGGTLMEEDITVQSGTETQHHQWSLQKMGQ